MTKTQREEIKKKNLDLNCTCGNGKARDWIRMCVHVQISAMSMVHVITESSVDFNIVETYKYRFPWIHV